jgi:proteasome lid subunit RPN8/RPN11
MKMLHAAIDELIIFFKKNGITFFNPVWGRNMVTIDFELPVTSYIAPDQQVSNFSFELTLWVEWERKIRHRIITKRGAHIPFHPHFEIRRPWSNGFARYAEWVGFERGEFAACQRIEHLLFSLQYKRDYIDVDNHIGNNEALIWYLKALSKNPNRFTTTDNPSKKHFEVHAPGPAAEKKKFEVTQGNPQPKKKFTIHEEVRFEPPVQPLPEYEVEHRLDSLTDSLQSRARIYISPVAREQIFSHIKWGDQHATETRSEQGGLLLGKVYLDEAADHYYGIAEQGIPGRSAQGTATYLEMTHQTWKEMIDSVDDLLGQEANKDLQIIGWYHTHPNNLQVFMSDTDMNTQKKYFNQDWHFAIVLNPHRQIWKAFSGPYSMECKGYFMSTDRPALPYEDASRSNDEEERRPVDPSPGEQTMDLKKVSLILALVLLIIAAYTVTRSKRGSKVAAAKTVKATQQVKPENKPPPKVVMPAHREEDAIETELKPGTVIHDSQQEEIFETPLSNPLTVLAKKINDSLANIETHLFAYKDGVKIVQDSALEISGNLRNANVANRKSMAGELTHAIIVSKGDYQLEGNWYKIKFVGVAKP